jgi:hypothetical protein
MNNRIKLLFQNPYLHYYIPSCLLYLQIDIETNIGYGHAVDPGHPPGLRKQRTIMF